jgi:uncharacterized phage protein (TIGR02220 family)
MEDIKKSYYAIIPANIRYDEELTANAKLLYGEISALCNERGFSWASNDYFAELYKVTDRQVRRWIKSLADKGYIYIQYQHEKSLSEKRYIYISDWSKMSSPDKNVHGGGQKSPKVGDKNVHHNNTYNNTSNKYIAEIVTYLNKVCGTSFRPTTKKTIALIDARLSEEYTLDNFKAVIDKKAAQWKGTEREQYLRPETLFGNKFEGYLNEKGRQATPLEGVEEEIDYVNV